MKVAEYVPIAMASLSPNTRRGWTTYSKKIVTMWGERDLADVRTTEIAAAARAVREEALARATSTMGTGAQEGFVSCARAVWNRAVADGYCERNPATAVPKPARRPPQARRALTAAELKEVDGVLAKSGDPELALAVFRIFLETGARRDELLGLRVRDLSTSGHGPTLTLAVGTKKYSIRHQPITDDLAEQLHDMATKRIGEDLARRSNDQLLRNLRKQPITHRWLEYRSKKIREAVPALGSTAEVWFTWHLLRHTAGVMMERSGGFAVAQTFLGHSTKGSSATAVTLHYSRASTDELRRVHGRIWGPPTDGE
jgi:integrase